MCHWQQDVAGGASCMYDDAYRLEQRRDMAAGKCRPSLCLTVCGRRLASQAARIRGHRQTCDQEDRLTDFKQGVAHQYLAKGRRVGQMGRQGAVGAFTLPTPIAPVSSMLVRRCRACSVIRRIFVPNHLHCYGQFDCRGQHDPTDGRRQGQQQCCCKCQPTHPAASTHRIDQIMLRWPYALHG